MRKWMLIGELPNVDNVPTIQERVFKVRGEMIAFLRSPEMEGHLTDGYSPLVLIHADDDGNFSPQQIEAAKKFVLGQ
jgi:hypothetical protein